MGQGFCAEHEERCLPLARLATHETFDGLKRETVKARIVIVRTREPQFVG
jgi:hypothetical protein